MYLSKTNTINSEWWVLWHSRLKTKNFLKLSEIHSKVEHSRFGFLDAIHFSVIIKEKKNCNLLNMRVYLISALGIYMTFISYRLYYPMKKANLCIKYILGEKKQKRQELVILMCASGITIRQHINYKDNKKYV